MTPSLIEELSFWFKNLQAFNGYSIRPKVNFAKININSDASETQFGGFSLHIDTVPVQAKWSSSDEALGSSTFRELKAIYYILYCWRTFLQDKRVEVFCDNENACRIISIGSCKPHLQNIAIDIFNLCLENPFEIEAQWLPREQNQIADQLSRFVDKATAPLITKFLRHLMHSGVLIR